MAAGQRTRIDMGSMTGQKAGGAAAKSKAGADNNTKKVLIAVSLFGLAGVVYFLNPFGGRSEPSTGGALTMGGAGTTTDQGPAAPPQAPPEDGTPAEDPNAQMPHPPLGPHLIVPEEVDPDDDTRTPEPPEPRDR